MIIRPSAMSVRVNKTVQYIPEIPEGFTVVRDTREQDGYKFDGICECIDKKLDYGDYSVRGFELDISVERKALGDFYKSITKDRERFERMLKRMQDAEFRGLIIEASEMEVMTPELSYSNISANSVYSTLVSFEIKYGVHVYMGNRDSCRLKLVHWLVMYYKEKRKA